MTGQLGNQMFQYAIYRKLALIGKNVKMDTSYYDVYPHHNSFYIFKLNIIKSTSKESLKEKDQYRSYLDRIRRKFLGRRNNTISEINNKVYYYNPNIFELKRGFIDGYWQSEKYFSDIKNILLNDFRFPTITDLRNKELLKKITETNSVSIHVRRGDYADGFPLLSKNYYEQAIKYFTIQNNTPFFYVFSNDIPWAKENMIYENIIFIDWNTGKESWKDMYLMTQCNHHIIANSSFSWWGAWLNQKENKEVIAPSVWFHHQETPDVYCEGWKIINI